MALLEIRSVTRRFGGLAAVHGVSLAIEAGELFLDGKPLAGIAPERRPVHTVFQSHALYPHMTVAGNIAFPLEMAGRPRERDALLLDEPLGALDAKLRQEMLRDFDTDLRRTLSRLWTEIKVR